MINKDFLKNRYNCNIVNCNYFTFFRSSSLLLDDFDVVKWLHINCDVNACFDLRTNSEIKKTFNNILDFEYINMPIQYNGVIDDYISYYFSIYEQCKSVSEKILDMNKFFEGRFLLCCNVGKDRTGLVTSIIQKKMNVDMQSIINEIIQCRDVSITFIEQMIKRLNTECSTEDYINRFEISCKALKKFILDYL